MDRCIRCGAINPCHGTSRKRGKGVLNKQVSEYLSHKRKFIGISELTEAINVLCYPDFQLTCARSIRDTPAWIKFKAKFN